MAKMKWPLNLPKMEKSKSPKFCAHSYSTSLFPFSANKVGNGDILCEMRFHVPNNELEIYQEEKEAEKAKKKADKKKAAGAEEKKDGDEEEESSSEEDEMTAAKLFD